MINNLKKHLTFLFIFSVMLIFSFVFSILIYENINTEKKVNTDFFNRITTSLVFTLENSNNLEIDLQNVEKNYHMYLQFFNNNWEPIYQSPNIFNDDTDSIIKSFVNETNKVEIYYLENTPSSSIGGSYIFDSLSGHSYIGTQCDIATNNGHFYHLYIIQNFDSSLMILKHKLPLCLIIWIFVFISIYILAHIIIRKAIKPAELAIHSQKDFIASVSHELKSPLSVILSSAEAISSYELLSEHIKNLTKIIDSECLRMSKLIQDLLLLTSIDTKTWTLNKSNVNIDSLVINLFEKYSHVCARHNLTLNIDIEDRVFPTFFADADRMEQLLSIFIENAINYSFPHTEILLKATLIKNTINFSVIDHGIGIPDKDKPFIYDRFFCADKSRTKKEHFGLGLSIAKELISMHKGSITLTDTPNGGCTFQISFPCTT